MIMTILEILELKNVDKIHTQLIKLWYFVIFSQSKNKKKIGRTYSSIYVTSSENPIERVRLNSVFLF
jgi:hypothetical protein